jgi:hypothetical protein
MTDKEPPVDFLSNRREFLRAAGLAAAGLAVAGCSASAPDQATNGLTLFPGLEVPGESVAATDRVHNEEPDPTSGSKNQHAHYPLVGPDTAEVSMDLHPGKTGGWRAAKLDARQMVRDGIAYHLAKATQGTDFQDVFFAPARKEAAKANLLFGGYHFLEHGNGARQADYFLNRLQRTGGTKGVIGMLDVEDYQENGRDLSPDYRDIQDFCHRYREHFPKRPLLLYSPSYYWGDAGRHGRLGNPPAPKGTLLDWPQYVDGSGPAKSLLKHISPKSTNDVYQAHQYNGYAEPFMRQYTTNGFYQQYQGQPVPDNPAMQGAGRVLDFNVCYQPWDDMLHLAGLQPGAIPHPADR